MTCALAQVDGLVLFIKVLKFLRQLFRGKNIVESKLLRGFYYLSFGSNINDFFHNKDWTKGQP